MGLRLDLLRHATEIYLGLAYPSGAVPEVVERRLVWREGCTADELLSGPPFERAGKAARAAGADLCAAARQSPLSAHETADSALAQRRGFHAFGQQPRPGFRARPERGRCPGVPRLQAENQRLKEAIEEAWDDAGLPTFLRYLRDYIKSRAWRVRRTSSTRGPQPKLARPT